MIIFKSFLRKKITKIYIFILFILLLIIMLLFSFIHYSSKIQDELFSNYSELVVINSYDIGNLLNKINNIANLNEVLAFKENKNYKIFIDGSYEIYDEKGNLIENYQCTDDGLIWEIMERENLEDYILVYPAKEFNLRLQDDEIVIGINDFWFSSYDESYYNNIINKKIGFIYNDNNIEFLISDVISVEQSILIISDDLYNNLFEERKNYVYTADIVSIKNQLELKDSLSSLSDDSSYIYSIVTFYKNGASNTISSLYDLIDILTFASYIAIFIFIIIIIVLTKNIIGDLKRNITLYRKLGFNKIQTKLQLIKNILLIYCLTYIAALIVYIVTLFIINYIFDINLQLINFNYIFYLFMTVVIIATGLVFMTRFKTNQKF